jgi:trimeric autotransporter adhesin
MFPSSVASGSTAVVTDTTKNQGAPTSNASTTSFYLSTNTIVDPSDTPLGTRAVAPLAPGVSSTGTTSVTIPAGFAPGTYYILGVADRDNGTAEGNEGNNTFSRAFVVVAGS